MIDEGAPELITTNYHSLGMQSSFTEHPQQKRSLLVGFKGRGHNYVGARFEVEHAKDRSSVSECDGPHLLLDHMQTIGPVLLNLGKVCVCV